VVNKDVYKQINALPKNIKLISVFILITGITTAAINIMPLIQFMALIQCNVIMLL